MDVRNIVPREILLEQTLILICAGEQLWNGCKEQSREIARVDVDILYIQESSYGCKVYREMYCEQGFQPTKRFTKNAKKFGRTSRKRILRKYKMRKYFREIRNFLEMSDVSQLFLNLFLHFMVIHHLGSRMNPFLKMSLVFREILHNFNFFREISAFFYFLKFSHFLGANKMQK